MSQLTFLGDSDHPGSPIRRQYLDIKRRYPDAILFFRLGDFYETFDDDARIVSSALDIVLTGREMGRGERVPLAGLPYHAAEGYIARLIAQGHRIAICEQLGTTPVRGLVPREVVRVITPGTLIEEGLLPARSNNFLASLVLATDGAGLALVDISTAEFCVTEMKGPNWRSLLASELARVRPAECVLPRTLADDLSSGDVLPQESRRTPRDDTSFSLGSSERLLRDHFKVATLDGFGLAQLPLAVRAAGSLLSYLRETQPASLDQLSSLRVYSLDRFMKLDATARHHLELTSNSATGSVEGSLLGVLDRTRTAMGGRLIRQWIGQPLLDLSGIQARLDAVQEVVRCPLGRVELGTLLSAIPDLERLASRASQRTLTARDCLGIARALRMVPKAQGLMDQWLPGLRLSESDSLDPCLEAAETIEATIADDPAAVLGQGVIRAGRSAQLDELRTITGDTRRWIAGLERSERERTGVRSLKIGYNKVFGYYIEVTRPNLDAATDEFARMKTGAGTVGELLEHFGYQRRQTLANGERFVTTQLKEQEARLEGAQEEIEGLEKQIFSELLWEIAAMASRIRGTAQSLARLDATLSLAEAAVAGRYVRPDVDGSTMLRIRNGRHPIVERMLPPEAFVPNDSELSCEGPQIALLTGPNMAGKSTYILGVALIALMAQVGSFVPAEEARVGLVDRIFTRVGAQHDVAAGKSTFLVEMSETANVLRNATSRSLVVLDEVGRGTSTYDGMSIARAVVEHLHDHPSLQCRTLFATHYHELTELEGLLPRVQNLRMDVLEEGDRVVFLHRVVRGGADRSYGIHVAQLAGVPAPVIRRAREILSSLESGGVAKPDVMPSNHVQVDSVCLAVVAALREMDVLAMTPMEAIAKLHELQKPLIGEHAQPVQGD